MASASPPPAPPVTCASSPASPLPHILVAILAKDKAHCLPLYLQCLWNQTWPKQQTHLYIRMNDNRDDTEGVLRAWCAEHGDAYASVFFDASSVSEQLKEWKQHEWNAFRFNILGRIRQDSVAHAQSLGAHYFVADCDNFIVPDTLSRLFAVRSLGVVAPMLVTMSAYSNFHYDIDANGYYRDSPHYMDVLKKRIKGLVEVPVVHCTYFVSADCLSHVVYNDGSNRYEYVVFSSELRKRGVKQYIDNRIMYGFIVFCETAQDLASELSKWSVSLAENFGAALCV